MIVLRVVRAWLISVVACALLLVAWVVIDAGLSGRGEHAWRNAIDRAGAFAAIFGAVAATLHVPIFLILNVLAAERLTRAVAVLVGAALAPAVTLALATAFGGSTGPQTPLEWSRYWLDNPAAFLASVVPFAIAGGVFGLAWVGRRARVTPSPSA